MKLTLKKCKLCCTEIKNFSVKKGNQVILENINLHLHCGDLTAVIGPNGAGKSTLLKAILGEIHHEGSLSFTDEKVRLTRKPNIGYVPQMLDFDKTSPVTVRDLFNVTYSNVPSLTNIFGPPNLSIRVKPPSSITSSHLYFKVDSSALANVTNRPP